MLYKSLIYLFQLSLENGVFPDHLKIEKVTPIYNAGDSSDISNYRLIFVPRLIYNLQVFKRK